MKHIKTFESFLNESLIEKKEELYIAHVDDSRKPGGSDKDIKKTYNLEVRDRDRDGFDIVGSKEDIQAFVDEYSIILVDDIESIDEANDLSYWKDYAEGSNQSPKWYSNEAKNPSAVNKLVDTVVNYELDQMDDKDADIDPSDMKTLTDLAMKYFKKFGSINGHIVSAMLFQEAKESFLNEEVINETKITWGAETVDNLNGESPQDFAKKYEGQNVDIFFTKDNKSAIVSQRMSNLVYHGKDSARTMKLNDIKYVYCGLEKEFYSVDDYKKIIKAVYSGKRAPVKPLNVNESVINEGKAPKTWDSMFAMKVIAAFKNKEIDPNDPKSIEKWDTAFNGGRPPRPPFETAAIIKYYQETGKGPDGKP